MGGYKLFINLSNHKSAGWSKSQLQAAGKWGEIEDFLFPEVKPDTTEGEISAIADRLFDEIMKKKPDAVMCQGEFTLSYALINRFKAAEVTVLAACSERNTVEKTLSDGSTQKTAVYKFIQFRQYE